jgi:hypothetical protein
MAYRLMPDAAYLRECFNYDPETGALRWLIRPVSHFESEYIAARINTRYTGQPITSTAKGYLRVAVQGKRYQVHRIIWKLMTGDEPPVVIDHIDRNRTNNRWGNLRPATLRENQMNRARVQGARVGVYFRRGKPSPWVATILVGCYSTAAEASAARALAVDCLRAASLWRD